LLPGFQPDPSQLPDGGGFIEDQRGECLWDPSCLTLSYVNLTSCETTPIEELEAFRAAMVNDDTLYNGLDVGPYYPDLPEVDAAVYDRLVAGDPTVTAGEIDSLNGQLVNFICPMPLQSQVLYDWCTKATPPLNQDSPYMTMVAQSRDLARNQTEKFRKRAAYLSDLRTRTTEVGSIFKTAEGYLTEPLTSPAAVAASTVTNQTGRTPTEVIRDLVQWFKDHAAGKADGLGNDVVYGWFSKPAKGATRGPLHLVRVQSSSPGYRQDLLNTFPVIKDYIGENGTERLPTIDTETNWNGSTRTYTLNAKDRVGYVGARVIRYDEDQGSVMRFLSGTPIWKMVFRNPHQTEPGAGVIDAVYENCTKHHYMREVVNGVITYPADSSSDTGNVSEGFIFDLPMPGAPPTPLSECARNAFLLLQRGIVSETCAKYEPVCKPPTGDQNCNYDIKFVSCK